MSDRIAELEAEIAALKAERVQLKKAVRFNWHVVCQLRHDAAVDFHREMRLKFQLEGKNPDDAPSSVDLWPAPPPFDFSGDVP